MRPSRPEPEPPCFVPCPHCDGLGRVELTGVYLATLVYLERLGLAVGRRNGRERLWRAT